MLLSKAILARDQVKGSQVDVIVQWDPERGIIISSDDDVIDKSDYTQRIPSMFSLQMGIRGEMASAYATEFIASISDVTAEFLAIRSKLQCGDINEAVKMLPQERLYDSLPSKIVKRP